MRHLPDEVYFLPHLSQLCWYEHFPKESHQIQAPAEDANETVIKSGRMVGNVVCLR